MPDLLVGPMLRYVDETSASIWVETTEPCEVTVAVDGARAADRTFTVHGHHYALVDVAGTGPYTVELDGRRVWPLEGFPDSQICPLEELNRVVFGSCRTTVPHDAAHEKTHGVDVLREYGLRLMKGDDLPSLIIFLGDQVYADEPSAEMLDFIHERRQEGPDEIVDFDEYAELYRLAWSDPVVRWLLSTVPTAMIFDDHDVRDDWNTSYTWRQEIAQVSWWPSRVTSALAAYWVYQHLGNLSPSERKGDPMFAAIHGTDTDGGAALDAFARRADQDPSTARWSYARDIGKTRLIMLDTRCARELKPDHRRMLDDEEWDWFVERATGDVDHLLIGSSVPVFLPSGIFDVESWNEAVAGGAWGPRAARVAERIRQAIDLEHWGAFRESFEQLGHVLVDVAAGRRGRAPATIVLLSGDVHYSYLAAAGAASDDLDATRIYQAVCSPIRNPLSRVVRLANVVASFGIASLVGGVLARMARLPRRAFRWKITNGPWFPNALATLDLDGRSAQVRWHTARPDYEELVRIELAP
ncbi:alkaline phosphatase D family protein [Sphaerisporangium sp. TRM90804]|uniref:alkaline phosphatase D family protein n=1 Tax=Sphaerisporangium sp. TRM90804 TaxID=3031113 RepID=UPI0024487941|nr:alkaline phosphatase D family protein [Sphaerisporangium sp. TRM90804]MDH2425032.1 alkaline phosphatase D family protein [Sphaerisporangium sp. TRM90804]